ncbi:MAG: N-acetylmuramoyl-L-alanine amidase [Actinomycetota bacterium]|nr:N-acetylmuramoyl-L-alanine amidase [Actinomycetota bacterium]
MSARHRRPGRRPCAPPLSTLAALVAAMVALVALVALVPNAVPVGATSNRSPRSLAPRTPPPTYQPASAIVTDASTGGYWLVTTSGGVFSFDAAFHGSAGGDTLVQPVVASAAAPGGGGYWLATADGAVLPYGSATSHGSMSGQAIGAPVVGMAATPDGGGYWLAGASGAVFPFGDASSFGSMAGTRLNRPIVGMATTPDGKGYWLVASDGGVFAFGDAHFFGSTGGLVLNKPVVGMAATVDGKGYWLVASDGGVFAFGDAHFFGSTGSLVLNKPVVGMASTADGLGYRLVASDGGVFDFGDATYHGSISLQPVPAASPVPAPTSTRPAVAVVPDRATGGYQVVDASGQVYPFGAPALGGTAGVSVAPVVGAASAPGQGYWLVATDGGVFSFGGAAFHGSLGADHLNAPVVGMAATPDGGGYWLVAADGGVFSFGGAAFHGSLGADHLNAPVVGMASTVDGRGYWLVASDGGVFSFGDAAFHGSLGAAAGSGPIVAIVADQVTGGYWLVAASGTVTGFDAPALPPAGGGLTGSAVAATSTSDGGGLWLVGTLGGVSATGDATWLGSLHAQLPPLAGKVVAIDPGHDGGNGAAPAIIDQPIDGGGFTEPCDTAGTETPSGYTEHAFNFDVAMRLAAILRSEGATVVLTRTTDTGVGPCVNVRAAIGNNAHADAAISIHGDGGPAWGSGFDVIEPLPVVSSISNNTAIVGPSSALAVDVRNAFQASTGEPPADYVGRNGIDARGDLGGLNLSTVPKVLIECANMQNAVDAANVESASWRQAAAQGLADGITAFLRS